MSVTTTSALPAATPTGDSRELSHDWCCDFDTGLCGADLAGSHCCPEDLSCGCQQCLVCDDLIELPCSSGCDQ